MTLPQYYTRLAPFAETFLGGQPILTWHHVGRRPRGARLKGLYVSPGLFARQLAELKRAGFHTPAFARATAGGVNPERNVFLTFDDGFRDVFEHALPILREHGFRAMLFLVADLIGKTNEWQQRAGDVVEPLMDEAQIREWLAAGHEIGSHTRTHPHLTRLPPEEAREEIVASKKKLEDRFGVAVEHFCYPYGDWNPAVRDLVAAAGYRSACTTEPGVNWDEGSALALRRFTARYPTRRLKAWWTRWRRR
jgi:peptidoglycan/xylan/chitin deacetylase (PgdA/CDA1 family)